jgi:hypothetical protein
MGVAAAQPLEAGSDGASLRKAAQEEKKEGNSLAPTRRITNMQSPREIRVNPSHLVCI